jgi:nucleotide-binding universal stress UspA family protein
MNEPQGGPPAIVVGIDGSEDSKHALRWAAQQAELTNAPLHAITAWRYPVDFGTAWQIPATYGRSHDFSHVDFSEDAKKTTGDVAKLVVAPLPVKVLRLRAEATVMGNSSVSSEKKQQWIQPLAFTPPDELP